MGSGKSVVGKKIAKVLNIGFYDLDHWIEQKARSPIHVIFKSKGEKYFRKIERQGVRVLTKKKSVVLATGGGAWADPENRRRLRRWGKVVWLRVKFNTVWKRVVKKRTQRPLVGISKKPTPEFKNLFSSREKLYSMADIMIRTDERTPAQSCKLLLKKLLMKNSSQ